MSKEAMKLALEALEMYCEHGAILRPLETRDALKEALAKQEQGEPEMVRNMRMWVTALKSVSDNGQHMNIPSELSSGTCWELAVALEQFIDTTPQQRKPLTEQEFEKLHYEAKGYVVTGLMDIVRVVEAAHGIKE